MRASEYPLPDYAVSVWHRGDALGIALPGNSTNGDPRTMFIPLDKLPLEAPGWRAFVTMLDERRRHYQANERAQFSTPGEPTSVQLEELAKSFFKRKKERTEVINEDIFTDNVEETDNA